MSHAKFAASADHSSPDSLDISDRASGNRHVTSLRTHEAVCAERYANLLTLLESTMRRVGRLEVLVVLVAGSVICGMAGIIVTLALKLGGR